MKLSAYLCLGLLTLSATACAGKIDVGAQLVSGDISRFTNHQLEQRADLSSAQLLAVYQWLERHQSGWLGLISEASINQPPNELVLKLNHSDGRTTIVRFATSIDGKYYLQVTGPGKWAYESFLGITKSWAAIRRLSDQELAEFKTVSSM